MLITVFHIFVGGFLVNFGIGNIQEMNFAQIIDFKLKCNVAYFRFILDIYGQTNPNTLIKFEG